MLKERDDGIEFVIAVRVGFLSRAATEHWLLAVWGRLRVVAWAVNHRENMLFDQRCQYSTVSPQNYVSASLRFSTWSAILP